MAIRVAVDGGLSGREGEVLLAAAEGMCTKQIALSLGISGKTVDYFWKRIFKKLGCFSHEEVMALLLRRACGEDPAPFAPGAPTRQGNEPPQSPPDHAKRAVPDTVT